ncbi:sulfatase [Amycolatopsis sp. NPDC058986]|uniref:sulfatase family protein n=1 Tax=unclassified Amycolatopsis TaxID=2618356 RepID=UPI0036723F26
MGESAGLSRRAFGTLLGATGAGVLAASGTASAENGGEQPFRAAPESPVRRPNLLVILGDDLGWADLSSYGSPHIRTPNLDRLAREGVRFTDAYSGSATCSPTRFSLYTGRYPGRLRGGLAEPIASPNELEGIPHDHPTLASLLADAGYSTALIGKWHCGYLPWFSPTRAGWQEFFGNFGGAIDYFSKLDGAGRHDLYEGEVEYADLRYYTDIITERAVEFVRRDHDRPWLLNLNFTTPHWPWETRDDKAVSDELSARIRAGERNVLSHSDGGSLETYRKMVEHLDSSVGAVLDALRARGRFENTLVLFASDNGGERWSYQWPLSGEKFGLQEGGIRVPTILRWPAAIRPRQVSDVPVVSPDWTATLLDIAGAKVDTRYPLDGRSLAGYLLRGRKAPAHDLFWRTRAERALRRGRWKYYRTPAGADQLFDVVSDPREQADRARAEAPRLAELRAAWEKIDSGLLRYPA